MSQTSTYSAEFTEKLRGHLRERITELLDELDPHPPMIGTRSTPTKDLYAAVREYLSLEES